MYIEINSIEIPEFSNVVVNRFPAIVLGPRCSHLPFSGRSDEATTGLGGTSDGSGVQRELHEVGGLDSRPESTQISPMLTTSASDVDGGF